MENLKENTENQEIKTEILAGNELIRLIYKGESLPQDKRFLDFKEGGAFKYFLITDLIKNPKNRFYPILKERDKIVGLSELEISPYEENVFWLKFLSVDPQYQDRGYASKLAEEIFRFVKENGATLEGSIYSKEGLLKLRPLFKKLANKFDVKFIDK